MSLSWKKKLTAILSQDRLGGQIQNSKVVLNINDNDIKFSI